MGGARHLLSPYDGRRRHRDLQNHNPGILLLRARCANRTTPIAHASADASAYGQRNSYGDSGAPDGHGHPRGDAVTDGYPHRDAADGHSCPDAVGSTHPGPFTGSRAQTRGVTDPCSADSDSNCRFHVRPRGPHTGGRSASGHANADTHPDASGTFACSHNDGADARSPDRDADTGSGADPDSAGALPYINSHARARRGTPADGDADPHTYTDAHAD